MDIAKKQGIHKLKHIQLTYPRKNLTSYFPVSSSKSIKKKIGFLHSFYNRQSMHIQPFADMLVSLIHKKYPPYITQTILLLMHHNNNIPVASLWKLHLEGLLKGMFHRKHHMLPECNNRNKLLHKSIQSSLPHFLEYLA